ncbi:MAG: DUF1638 domain-containing protein [Methanomassiliicoccales archaeon]|nr:MAG: DUF1638 domain-containing protein [Methanomassiliicoccales archaeon]
MTRIAIVACETFKKALEILTEGDRDFVHKEYLEFGLHEWPEDLKRTVIEKVNSLEGKVDAVLLGYGTCNSLRDITSKLKVPTLTFEADDCIGVLLTPAEYDKERKKCAGTMYHTPYFAEMGVEWFEKRMKKEMPNYEELGITTKWFLDQIFAGYSRVLYIDDGLGDRPRCEKLSKDFAREMNLRFESRCGTLELLEAAIARVKEMASKTKKNEQVFG